MGFEPTTCSLRVSCSTTELGRHDARGSAGGQNLNVRSLKPSGDRHKRKVWRVVSRDTEALGMLSPPVDRATALLWWHLHVLTKTRYDAVRGVYGSLEDASKHLSEEFLRSLNVREETVRTALLRLEEFDAHRIEGVLRAEAIGFLTIEDDAYPAVLRQTADPPIFLSYRGDPMCLREPLLAVVGTRRMSPYGKRLAGCFVPAFVRAGCVTVSGLALGIDTAVARETLLAGGRTIAVLGSGLRRVHPQRNRALAEEIVAKGGLLLSEFPIDLPPSTFTFPARNRIIAGLTRGTLVLEAPADSGALITASFALDEGREVFAVPGNVFDPNFAGCHVLIARGHARLVSSPEEVLQEVGVAIPSGGGGERTFLPQSEDESRVFGALTTLPQTVDQLVEKVRMPASTVGSTLTVMEIAGVARNLGGGGWVKN